MDSNIIFVDFMDLDYEELKDYQSAIYWLNIAMEKGIKKAYEHLAVIYGSEAYYDEDKLAYVKQMSQE